MPTPCSFAASMTWTVAAHPKGSINKASGSSPNNFSQTLYCHFRQFEQTQVTSNTWEDGTETAWRHDGEHTTINRNRNTIKSRQHLKRAQQSITAPTNNEYSFLLSHEEKINHTSQVSCAGGIHNPIQTIFPVLFLMLALIRDPMSMIQKKERWEKRVVSLLPCIGLCSNAWVRSKSRVPADPF